MPIDQKVTRHICNVVRRQIQGSFPELYVHFVIHGENNRAKAFARDRNIINDHPAGYVALNYRNVEDTAKIMNKNRSRFVSIARHNKPGFLGFFENNAYLAFCFINYSRFSSEDSLRNHALHMAWHAVSLYKEFKDTLHDKKKAKHFRDDNQLLIPDINIKQLYHRNLMGDIFSASAQTLQGREEAFLNLTRQRIHDTLSPSIGFRAENYPFPVCLDTLEFVFKNNISQYKKTKKSVLAATKMTEEIGETYDPTSIEQWYSFSLPAQKMAWAGQAPETILGAALYTSENAYVQSIADIVADKAQIKPESVTMLSENNPFANPETNQRMHKKQCYDLVDALCKKTHGSNDSKQFIDAAKKQSGQIIYNKVMGWCASALLTAAEIISQHDDKMPMKETIQSAIYAFEREVDATPWDTLTHLSDLVFEQRREGSTFNNNHLLDLTANHDEFTSIHYTLQRLLENDDANPKAQEDSSTENSKQRNIGDFISPNAIKNTE